MQPHFPSIPEPIGDGIELGSFGQERASTWTQLENDDITREDVCQSYRANLRYVLNSIEILLENIDVDRVAVSSDHGNLFGKFGIYGHPPNIPIKNLRQVPWVETTGTDSGTYSSSIQREEADIEQKQVRSRLEDLGYI
jgi:hypothetical protein